jgi:hypothetical protein
MPGGFSLLTEPVAPEGGTAAAAWGLPGVLEGRSGASLSSPDNMLPALQPRSILGGTVRSSQEDEFCGRKSTGRRTKESTSANTALY